MSDKLKNFVVNYTLSNGVIGDYEAVSPSSTLAALDFCQFAYENKMAVSSISIDEAEEDGE
ncbi:hypothetical protein Phi2_0062 [Vibrio phage phi 2]|uniref:hypothetical protein n=1 Tax=Vibrio phage X29 TaxID=1500713 RepID=UPI00045FB95B|nr:hypothetical protein SBVcX29_0007 [Vibrio phage X29]AHN84871.1 hypothetical protein Phi2_0062 [Vibrio phage phi 2]AIA10286.1 hypothetical protein SBVcX29_0007 [Vibrio phage X29]